MIEVSVIVAVYNAEKTLERCVDSVINQTCGLEKIELILADDCSTDRSRDIIERCCGRWPKNVRSVFLPRNSGVAGAPRNAAMAIARGQWLLFLDADDVLEPDSLRLLLAAAKSEPGADIVSGGCRYMQPDGVLRRENGNPASSFDCTGWSDPLCAQLGHCMVSKLFKSSIVRDNKIEHPEGVASEDVAFMCMYTSHCRTACTIPEPIQIIYELPGSVSRSGKPSFWLGNAESMRQALCYCEKNGCAGHAARFYGSIDHFGWIVEKLFKSEYPRETLTGILEAYRAPCRGLYEAGMRSASPLADILLRDLAGGDTDIYELFCDLRDLYGQREREMGAIFGSTTYRLSQKMSRLLGRR